MSHFKDLTNERHCHFLIFRTFSHNHLWHKFEFHSREACYFVHNLVCNLDFFCRAFLVKFATGWLVVAMCRTALVGNRSTRALFSLVKRVPCSLCNYGISFHIGFFWKCKCCACEYFPCIGGRDDASMFGEESLSSALWQRLKLSWQHISALFNSSLYTCDIGSPCSGKIETVSGCRYLTVQVGAITFCFFAWASFYFFSSLSLFFSCKYIMCCFRSKGRGLTGCLFFIFLENC